MIKKKDIPRLKMLNHTAAINDSQYKNFALHMNSDKLKLPYTPEIEKEMLGLKQTSVNKDRYKIQAGGKGHDDLSDAIVRSLYLATAYHNDNKTIASSLPGLLNKQNLVRRMYDGRNSNVRNGIGGMVNRSSNRNPKNIIRQRVR